MSTLFFKHILLPFLLCLPLPIVSQEASLRSQQAENEHFSVAKEKPLPSYKLSGTLTFVSDYRDRGISQTMLQPAVQGEFKFTHQSGLYLKTWASNVDGTGNFISNTSLEWDFYIGLSQKIDNSPFSYDVGFQYYWYPGGETRDPHPVVYNSLEYYVGIQYKSFEVKLTQTLTNYFGVCSDEPPINWNTKRSIKSNGHSYNSPYLEANYNWKIGAKWISQCHIGYQRITNYPELNFIDWKVTFIRNVDWFTVSLAYVQADARRAFYNVPDNRFKPHRKWLAGPTAVLSVYRDF